MAEQIEGFGGVKFTRTTGGTNYTATFLDSYGEITRTPIRLRKTNVKYKIKERLLGFRVTIKVKLYNVKADSYIELQNLYNILNSMVSDSDQREIRVYPKYDLAQDDNVSYVCLLDSNIAPKPIAKVKIGETLVLNFISTELEQLKTTTGISDSSYWVDEAGNKFVDESLNKFILKNN